MTIVGPSITVSVAKTAPHYLPDLRPTADAAALRDDTRPPGNLALPGLALPPGPGQTTAVSRGLLVAEPGPVDQTEPVGRVLKPFGMPMLPDRHLSDRAPPDGPPQDGPDADRQPLVTPPHAARAGPTGADAGSVTAARVYPPPQADRPGPAAAALPVADAPARDATGASDPDHDPDHDAAQP